MLQSQLEGAARARGEDSLSVAERVRLAAFHVPKRRDDWLLGRIAAKEVVAAALAELIRCDPARDALEIASEATGMPYARIAPEAPAAVAGFAPGERLPLTLSISHAEGQALCAAAWSPPVAGARSALGIDLGRVEPRSPAFVETFLTEDERRFVRNAPKADGGLRANLVWCAKEAVLKALGVGLTVDTREVSCLPRPGVADPAAWRLAPADAAWRPFLAACSPALAPGGSSVHGVWRVFPGFVAALAAAPW